MINNKRAEVQQMILVLMILSLCFWALFNFYIHSDKFKSEIVDSYLLNKVYSEELNWQSKAYFQVRQEFIENYAKSNLNMDSSDKLNQKIEDNLNKIVLIGGKNGDESKKITVSMDNNSINVNLEEVQINGAITLFDKKRIWMWGIIPLQSYDEVKAFIAVVYRKNINFGINIDELGLSGLDKIESSISDCNNNDVEKMKSCLQNKLFNFNVNVELNGDNKLVSIESKKRFLVNNEIRSIKFGITT